MRVNHLAVVMPAYNEAEGIVGFLEEIDEHIAPIVGRRSIVVVDDQSSDDMVGVLEEFAATRMPHLRIVRAPRNRGHGPTALEAYRAGLELDPDVLVHVDGDGQFLGKDFPRLIEALEAADVSHGIRRQRSDPWFRRVVTAGLAVFVFVIAGRGERDVNTPLRAYRPSELRRLLERTPSESLVPHVHFSIIERRMRLRVVGIPVRSLPRRGAVASGTMWGPQRKAPKLPPKKLIAFVGAAIREVLATLREAKRIR